MARLTYSKRKSMPKSDFALPAKRQAGKGGYPDEDRSHARSALQRVSEFGSPSEKREVRAKVEKKYPGMVEKGDPDHGKERREMGKRSIVPTGGPHQENHREPRSHDEFERLGNGKR